MFSPKKKKNVLPPKDVELDNNNNNKWFTFYKEKFGSPTRNTSSRNNKLLFQRSFELATLLPSREKGVAHSSSPSELKKRICSMKRSDSSTVLPPAFKRIPSYEEERKKNPVRVLGGAGGSNRDRKPSRGHNISPKTLDRDLNNSDARGRSSGNAKEVDSNYFQSSSAYGRGDPGLAKDLPAAGRPSGSSVTIGSNVARDLYNQFESLPSHQAEIFQPPQGRRRSISSSTVSTPPYPEGSITYRNHLQTTSSSGSKVRKPSHSSTGFGYTNPNEGRGASPPSGEESSSESSTESLSIAGSTSSQSNRIVRDEPKNDDKSSCSSSGSISPLPLGSRMTEMKLLNPDQQQKTRGPSTTNDKPKFASSSIRRPSYSNSFTRAGSSSSSGMQRDSGGNRSTHYTGSGVHGLVGLVNEGNTCYLNSCLQCLAHSMPLASAVQGPVDSLVQRQGSGSRAGTSERDFSSLAEVLSHAFRQVVKDLWQRPAFTTTRARAFLQCVQAWAPQFAGHSQHDAQEVLRAILDGLHEALNRVTTAPPYRDLYLEPKPEDELAELTWRYHKLCQDSIIQDIFCGQLQSTIECCTCHRKSHCFDPFHDLSLPLPRESSIRDPFRGGNSQPRVTLHDCLSAFVAPEQLEGSNKYYCPSCKAPRTSVKKLTLYRLPPILVLHIKRFYKSERFSYQKDDTPVYYPLEGLDFTDFLSARARKIRRTGVVYDLYGVCCHMGSLGCGHYTAQCKNCENELWYCFNDSSVTPLHDAFSSSASVVLTNDAETWEDLYCLVYEERAFHNFAITPGPGWPTCASDVAFGVVAAVAFAFQFLESVWAISVAGFVLCPRCSDNACPGTCTWMTQGVGVPCTDVEHSGHLPFTDIPSGVNVGFKVV